MPCKLSAIAGVLAIVWMSSCARDPSAIHDPLVMLELIEQDGIHNEGLYRRLAEVAQGASSDQAKRALAVLARIPNRGQQVVFERVVQRTANPAVKIEALYAMGVLGDPRAVPYLLQAIRNEAGDVALAGRYALWLVRHWTPGHYPWGAGGWMTATADSSNALPMPPANCIATGAELEECRRWWHDNGARVLVERLQWSEYWYPSTQP